MLPALPRELELYIFALARTSVRREAVVRLQRAIKMRARPRLHFGHALSRHWPSVKQRMHDEGVLLRLYPYPHVRHEWRTEAESWIAADLQALVRDVEGHTYWGAKAPSLAVL